MEKEYIYIVMEINFMDNGRKIYLMVLGFTSLKMAIITMDC